jgi:ABC-type uncharacterized transport system involved in gliding motility auxiliary subunit
MKNRMFVYVLGLVVAMVLLVAINMVSGKVLAGARLDLTENQLFTLSEGSRKVLAQIEEPVTLRLFRSRKEAEKYLGGYSRRVEEFLREYATASDGKLTLEILDPEPYSETEEKAIQAGLRAAGGPPLAADEQLYFGLVGSNSVGDQKSIGFLALNREPFLEYDVSKLIYDLAHPEKTVVGVLSSLPIEGQVNPFVQQRNAPQPWMVLDMIREFYEVKTIQPGATSIPADVQLLMLVHPKGLSDATQYAIDQFVLRGGKALVFVDPYCSADEPPSDPQNPLQAMMAPRNSELPRLLSAWGVQSPKDKLAADRNYATPVTWNNGGRAEQVAFVAWMTAHDAAFSKDEVPTRELKVLQLQYPGFLEPVEGATTTFTPLVQTTEDSMEIATTSIQFSPDPPKLLADFFPSGKRMTVAARINGKCKSAFPEGKPAAAPGEEGVTPADAPAEHLAESQGDISVIVVADADLLQDDTWVQVMNLLGTRIPQKSADNGDFVMNAIDFLGGSTDLVSLRARGSSAYPMLVVDALKREAEQNLRATEQKLVEEKQKTERELQDLLSKAGAADAEQVLMSAEAQAKVETLRGTLVDTNRKLREVRYNLSKDVEWLGIKIKLLNILLPPFVVTAAALFVFAFRVRSRRTA